MGYLVLTNCSHTNGNDHIKWYFGINTVLKAVQMSSVYCQDSDIARVSQEAEEYKSQAADRESQCDMLKKDIDEIAQLVAQKVGLFILIHSFNLA